jgi:hypothetical protein
MVAGASEHPNEWELTYYCVYDGSGKQMDVKGLQSRAKTIASLTSRPSAFN